MRCGGTRRKRECGQSENSLMESRCEVSHLDIHTTYWRDGQTDNVREYSGGIRREEEVLDYWCTFTLRISGSTIKRV